MKSHRISPMVFRVTMNPQDPRRGGMSRAIAGMPSGVFSYHGDVS